MWGARQRVRAQMIMTVKVPTVVKLVGKSFFFSRTVKKWQL
jgi:hypothetical protein